jgi:hypothetical protein
MVPSIGGTESLSIYVFIKAATSIGLRVAGICTVDYSIDSRLMNSGIHRSSGILIVIVGTMASVDTFDPKMPSSCKK